MVKIETKLIIISLLLLLLNSCANQLPPGGGEVDKIPPEIVETYPLPNTINYDENYFEIEFSEYVDKRSFNDALFISPNIEGRLLFNWTGTTVTVEFENKLEKDVTYTITVGTDLVDRNNKNRMATTYSFAFSTGNNIDKRIISGKVYDADPEGILIYAYRLDTGIDTLLNKKPNYVSQTGKDGTFKLNGLGEANYRVFAVKDEYRDLLYTLDQDMIGVPRKDIILSGQDTIFTDLNFKLFKADTTAPRLLKAIMTDQIHILTTVTELLDSSVLKKENFYLFDSTENKKSSISYIFRKYGKIDEIVLITEENLSADNTIFLYAKNLADTSHNVFTNDYVQLIISERKDTTPVNIIAAIPSSKNVAVDYDNPQINLFFDDAIIKDNIKSTIQFSDTLNNIINYNLKFTDDASVRILPLNVLSPATDYKIKCDLNILSDVSGNTQDSLYVLNFKTISGLDYTGVTGSITNIDSGASTILVLESIDKKNLRYQMDVNEDTFSFEKIAAGKYKLWCYYDLDKDKRFNYGWPQPIEYSEQFFVYPDTLKLKPRWIVTDVLFSLD